MQASAVIYVMRNLDELTVEITGHCEPDRAPVIERATSRGVPVTLSEAEKQIAHVALLDNIVTAYEEALDRAQAACGEVTS